MLANPLALQLSTLDYGSNHGSLSFARLRSVATLAGLANSNWDFTDGSPKDTH